MSTNYYWVVSPKLDYHIGMSACGWAFALHVEPEDWNISSLSDWIIVMSLGGPGRIMDEYDDELSLEELLKVILDRPHGCKRWYDAHVVSQGSGPWSCIRECFS